MTPSKEAHALMQAYFSGKATPDQHEALEQWLREDAAHVQLFVDLALLDGMVLSEQKNEDAAAVLAMLREAEERAEPDFSLLEVPASDDVANDPHENAVTLHDLWTVGGYLMARGLRSRAGVIGSIAAVVALALALVFVFKGDPAQSPQDQPLANDDTAAPVAVATLTAQYDAQWADSAEGASAPGSQLRAGQRLTLTVGFAEITTARGAVAILQAPATVELLNDNALRLHAGKLVGVCETESSKGFVVRTPHMDVTDLGTRFGVDADSRATEVHVLEGEVELLRPDAAVGVDPIVLVRGQSAGTSADSETIAAIDHDMDRFVALMPEAIRPETVAGWQITAINGQTLESPGAMRVSKRAEGSPWITADRPYPQQVNDETTFTVQTRFDLPANIDGDTAILLLQFDANDRVTQVRLNGRAFTPPANHKDDGHDGMHTMRIDGALLAGQNTLQLDVVDVRRSGATKWEMRADWSIQSAQPPADEGGQAP